MPRSSVLGPASARAGTAKSRNIPFNIPTKTFFFINFAAEAAG
jgi:hypothetical protein